MMQGNEDDIYSHEVAKRSVARAALHLGVDSMSEEALNVMADVLMTYLQRIGSSLSSIVESSNRTSAHVNVLDALRATDMCTAPAVHQMHLEGEIVSTNQATNNWQDLAAFLFGQDWQTQTVIQPTVGGKVGPSSSVPQKKKRGWEAPYLEDVANYPNATEKCANPHSLPSSVALSLYGGGDEESDSTATQQLEQEVQAIPDEAFATNWGVVDEDTRKKKAADEPEGAPPTKRVKLNNVTTATTTRPLYVPSFLPPFPSAGTGARAIVAADDDTIVAPVGSAHTADTISSSTTTTTKDAVGVRASLVQMEQQKYWGSGWDVEPSTNKNTIVPLGRNKSESTAPVTAVVPLARASGSRTSRILEGSMDVTH